MRFPNIFMYMTLCNRNTLNTLSTYACESLFSVINFIKSRKRSSLTDETSSSCISLKVTKYQPGVNLSAVMQQQQKSYC